MGALFGILTALSIGMADLSGRRLLRESSVVTATIIIQAVAGLGALVVVLVVGGEFLLQDLAVGMLSGIGFAGGLFGYLAALNRVSSAIVAPVSATLAATIPYGWSVLRGAAPSGLALLGASIALAGVLVVTSARPGKGTGAHLASEGIARAPSADTAGMAWAVLSGCSYGFGLAALLEVSADSGSWPAMTQRFAAAAVMILIALRRQHPLLPPPRLRAIGLLTGVFAAGSSIFYLLGVRVDEPTTIVITSMYPAVTVSVGRLFYNDSVSKQQICGIALVLLGITGVVSA